MTADDVMDAPAACSSCRGVHATYVCRSKINSTAIVTVWRGTLGSAMRTAAERVEVGDDGLCSSCRALPHGLRVIRGGLS